MKQNGWLYQSKKEKLEILINELNQWIIDNNVTKYIDRQLDLFTDTKSISNN